MQGLTRETGMTARTTWRLGEAVIHRLVEQAAGERPAFVFLPGLDPALLAENRHWLRPWALDDADNLLLCFQSWLVETPRHRVLIDSCIGNDKTLPDRPAWHGKRDGHWQAALAAAGIAPEQVDYVLCTHLHADHVGWNTRREDGRWVPTFPNARYLISARELGFWQASHEDSPLPWIEESVLPVIAAGRAELVASDHALDDLIRLRPTPGHTIDHFAVELGRGAAEAVFTGDLLHSPLQARYPELAMRLDHDPAQAVATRRAFLESVCDTPTLCCFAHFPSPSVARVTRWGEGFRCEPAA
jgi:glyoxylase-like metal-dependent hydrolase (beta-lactamase superfamily II)